MKPAVGLELQGRYQLIERIALGGMGEVWRATDLRSGRMVAAKILRPELAGDEIFLSRLRAEATNSRGLRHPNLAIVLDAGERDGSGWIIMELVQGRALSDIITDKGTMAPAEILPILAQVARALQVVHDSGVIHRDVKPSNILINREGLAKLTDFGISTGVNQRPMTATGMVMGTAAGDLYALGIIAYEALAGRRPFTGTTQVDIAFAHVNEPVPPLPNSVPAEVNAVVMELLAKKPADRPPSAREVARRLDRIVVNLPADSWDPRQTPTWTSTGRRVDRSRTEAPGEAASRSASAEPAPRRRRRRARDKQDERNGNEPDRRAGRRSASDGGSGSTRAFPIAERTRAAAAGLLEIGPNPTRHASGRGLFGLPLAQARLVALVAVAVLTLLAIVVAAGTLTSAQPGVPRGQAVVSTIPLQEAL